VASPLTASPLTATPLTEGQMHPRER